MSKSLNQHSILAINYDKFRDVLDMYRSRGGYNGGKNSRNLPNNSRQPSRLDLLNDSVCHLMNVMHGCPLFREHMEEYGSGNRADRYLNDDEGLKFLELQAQRRKAHQIEFDINRGREQALYELARHGQADQSYGKRRDHYQNDYARDYANDHARDHYQQSSSSYTGASSSYTNRYHDHDGGYDDFRSRRNSSGYEADFRTKRAKGDNYTDKYDHYDDMGDQLGGKGGKNRPKGDARGRIGSAGDNYTDKYDHYDDMGDQLGDKGGKNRSKGDARDRIGSAGDRAQRGWAQRVNPANNKNEENIQSSSYRRVLDEKTCTEFDKRIAKHVSGSKNEPKNGRERGDIYDETKNGMDATIGSSILDQSLDEPNLSSTKVEENKGQDRQNHDDSESEGLELHPQGDNVDFGED